MLLCEALCASATGALSVVIPGQLVSDGQTVVTPLTVVPGDLQPRRVGRAELETWGWDLCRGSRKLLLKPVFVPHEQGQQS